MNREVMQQVLEALGEINKLSIGEHAICLPAEIDTAMAALRAALAEPEQPVAWMCPDDPDRRTAFSWPGTDKHPDFSVALYTAPTPRKPLTEEQHEALKADAARYRWLRDSRGDWAICEWEDSRWWRDSRAPSIVDAAIDAAMKEMK